MQFGYFILTDTPPAYGTGRRNPQPFLCEVLEALGFNSVTWRLLSAVMADMLTAFLVRGEQHPLSATVLPAQAMQHTFE